jgi:serpin B
MKTLVKGNSAFAWDLYRCLASQDSANIFFSPYSISVALAMSYAGAAHATREQMAKAMHFSLMQSSLDSGFADLQSLYETIDATGSNRLKVANSMWVQKDFPLLNSYRQLVVAQYSAAAENVDFAGNADESRLRINSWVEGKTEHKIRDLLQPGLLDQYTRLVLVNAVYFLGSWAIPFDSTATREMPFQVSSSHAVTVPMMQKTGSFEYTENQHMQVLQLPYAGGNLSMQVILPKRQQGMRGIQGSLPQAVDEAMRGARVRSVKVLMPRFSITRAFRLDSTLKELGMRDAFTSPADFSGMTGNRDLYISAVVHKAFVAVNEKGTEAAAATAVVYRISADGPVDESPVVFTLDHPFIFVITDNYTGGILFLGRVVDPTNTGE